MQHDNGVSAAPTGLPPASRAEPVVSGVAGIPNATRAYHTLDKSRWQHGPWQSEPDKVEWRDEATGLPCLIVRGPCGALCGYVGVSPGHPWHGADYDAIDVEVHWGLTFAERCQHGDPAYSVCHIPAEGEADDVWWLGFDCAHSGDYTDMKQDDAWRARFPDRGVYRDIPFVADEVRSLAAQAKTA